MDADYVKQAVADALARAAFPQVPPGATVGTAWSAEQWAECRARLLSALVDPYLQRFELRETFEQIESTAPATAQYWVVARSASHLEWFDPVAGEFGLGEHVEGHAVPISVGVRGDLIGVFGAI